MAKLQDPWRYVLAEVQVVLVVLLALLVVQGPRLAVVSLWYRVVVVVRVAVSRSHLLTLLAAVL
jgi:hypothetical protein